MKRLRAFSPDPELAPSTDLTALYRVLPAFFNFREQAHQMGLAKNEAELLAAWHQAQAGTGG